MTLRWRIALILAAVACIVGAFAATASFLSTASELRQSIDGSLRTTATRVNVADSGDIGRGGRGARNGDGDGVNGSDNNGCPGAGSFQPASAAQIVGTDGSVTVCIEGGRYRVLTVPWHDGGTLQIARSLAESDSLLDDLRLQLFALVTVGVAAAAALGWAVASRVARPIMRLRDAAHHIATTLDFATPVDISSTGEVGDLAHSFSTMVEAVARSQEQ